MAEEINHPQHYNQGVETIEIIEGLGWGWEFCAGNVIKYVMRAKYKGSCLKDLKKAQWYLERLIKIQEKENSEAVEDRIKDITT